MEVTKKAVILLMVLLPVFFTACDDDGYSLGDIWVSIATVENPDEEAYFFLNLDNQDRMWIAATNLPFYRPGDGQRIIADYTVLSDKAAGSAYDHDIKLNNVLYSILTKDIFDITPETQDSIGNDPLRVEDMWIGSHYLNVEFVFGGQNRVHAINLVKDDSKIYEDGKVHLEFRHNANGDNPVYKRWGLASFDLRSLGEDGVTSVDIVVHTLEDAEEAPEAKEYEFTYVFNNPSTESKTLLIEESIGEIK